MLLDEAMRVVAVNARGRMLLREHGPALERALTGLNPQSPRGSTLNLPLAEGAEPVWHHLEGVPFQMRTEPLSDPKGYRLTFLDKAQKDIQLFKSSAFDGSASAMMMIDRDFTVLAVNEATKKLFIDHGPVFKEEFPHFNSDDMLGTCIDVFHEHPEHQRKMLSDPSRLPYRTNISVGALRLELNISGVFDEDGAYVGNVLEWADVTQQQADAAIVHLIQATEFTPDGIILDANETLLKMARATKDQLVGQHHAVLVPEHIRTTDEYRLHWEKLAAGEPLTGTLERVDMEGRQVCMTGFYSPVRNHTGQVYKVVKVASDVTAMEVERRRAVAMLQTLYREQALVEVTKDGEIIRANQNFLRILGFAKDQVEGRPVLDLVARDVAGDELYTGMKASVLSGTPQRGIFEFAAADGR